MSLVNDRGFLGRLLAFVAARWKRRRAPDEEVRTHDRPSDEPACTLLAIRAANVAQLCEKWGEATTYLRVSERFRTLKRAVESHGGQVVKEVDQQLLAAFLEATSAERAAADILDAAPPVHPLDAEICLRTELNRATAPELAVNSG